jgi:hypothetical protein
MPRMNFLKTSGAIVAALLALVLSACHLTPEAANVIKAVDLAACTVLEARLPCGAGQIVGDVCAADKPLLDAVLAATAESPPSAPTRVPTLLVARPRPPVRCGARAIGHIDPDLAPRVQAQLDARPECVISTGAP